MRISDWSSDVCSSDLRGAVRVDVNMAWSELQAARGMAALADAGCELVEQPVASATALARLVRRFPIALMADESLHGPVSAFDLAKVAGVDVFAVKTERSEEHTSELQSLMRNSYAVF